MEQPTKSVERKRNCHHNNTEVYSRMISRATREEPAEYLEWGICKGCGKLLDYSDMPSDAEITDGDNEPSIRGMPSEFYD